MKLLPRSTVRWSLLGIVAIAIILFAAPGDDGTAEATHVTGRVPGQDAPVRADRQAEAAHVELERLVRAQPKTGTGNAFGVTSWYVPPPPPPPAPPAPPPVPTAPPLPFTYLGRYEDAPTRLAILVKGERMYTVAEGDVIEDTYRIERVTPGGVELTYLPLDIRQTLNTGEGL
ncbi:MAG TPA: hypothetical protein VGD24_10405 [Gallionella sp.]